jgi:broad specificity phosphatase PhoE
MALLAIIRHGATEWTAARRLQGRADIGLSAAGRDAVSHWRLPPDVIGWPWDTSPLQRCLQTAAILRQTHPGAGRLHQEARLIEMSFGSWEGQTLADLRAAGGRAVLAREQRGLDFRAPGGESPRDLQQRLQPWLDAIATADRHTLAIAHKGVIRALYALATGWDMRDKPPDRLAYDALHLFEAAPTEIRIVALNRRLDPAVLATDNRA